MLLLTNAVHFQESWTVAFEEVLEPIDFQLMNGGVSKVRMMKRVSYEIMTGIFKFEKVLPEMNMIIVTLRYSVNSFLMKNVLVFFYFSHFLITISTIQIEKIFDGVLGIWTHVRWMVGTDETTELWRPPKNILVELLGHLLLRLFCLWSYRVKLLFDESTHSCWPMQKRKRNLFSNQHQLVHSLMETFWKRNLTLFTNHYEILSIQ